MATATLFKPATREKLAARIAVIGPAKSGKTFTSLRIATALLSSPENLRSKIAVINTEPGSIRKYLGLAPDGIPWDFSIIEPSSFAPTTYTQGILAAAQEQFEIVLIDSLSHAWEGEGGSLDQVDHSDDKNKFSAWKDVTPQHRRMIEAINRSPCHVICTMRTKTEYVLEKNDKGQTVPRKIGLAPVQRAGVEYEFDLLVDMNVDHLMTVSGTRCPEMDGLVVCKPSMTTFLPLARWLSEGSEPPEGYYARTEADLKTETAAIQASKSPEERKREAAAAQRAAANGKNGADPASDHVTPAHVKQITALAESIEGFEPADLLAMLGKYKANGIGALTDANALLLIGDLHARKGPARGSSTGAGEGVVAGGHGSNGQANGHSPASPTEPTPFDTDEERAEKGLPVKHVGERAGNDEQPAGEQPPALSAAPGSITKDQYARLMVLKDATGWPLEKQREYTAKRKVNSFHSISEADAATLIGQLESLVPAESPAGK